MIPLSKQNIQVLYLYVATFLGSLLGFVTSIVNTRFLTEAEYGDVRYVQNLITLFASLLLFGYFLSGSRLLALSGTKEYSRKIRGAMVVVLVVCAAILLAMTALAGVFHFGEENVRLLFWVSLPVCLSASSPARCSWSEPSRSSGAGTSCSGAFWSRQSSSPLD